MVTALQSVTIDIRRGTRGRPKAPWRSMADKVAFVYLVRLSKMHEIDTIKFLKRIHSAWINGEASCDGVSIQRRQMTEDVVTLLLLRGDETIAQVRLTPTVLHYLVKPEILSLRFEGYISPKVSVSRSGQVEELEINELNAETRRFNLEAKVTEMSPPRLVRPRWGDPLLLSTATIMDHSGTIKLPLWKEKISTISVGDLLRIENARVKRFRGELQVRVDKSTRLSVVENQHNKKQSRAARTQLREVRRPSRRA